MSSIYEIRLSGRLSPTLSAQFEQFDLYETAGPETMLVGPVQDQSALYGLVRRIEALGLDLVELRRLPQA